MKIVIKHGSGLPEPHNLVEGEICVDVEGGNIFFATIDRELVTIPHSSTHLTKYRPPTTFAGGSYDGSTLTIEAGAKQSNSGTLSSVDYGGVYVDVGQYVVYRYTGARAMLLSVSHHSYPTNLITDIKAFRSGNNLFVPVMYYNSGVWTLDGYVYMYSDRTSTQLDSYFSGATSSDLSHSNWAYTRALEHIETVRW